MKAFLRLMGMLCPDREPWAVDIQPSKLSIIKLSIGKLIPKTQYLLPIFFLVFVSCGASLAQESVGNTAPAAKAEDISGIVVSAETGEPLEGATVKIKNTTNSTITNTKGEFTLNTNNSVGEIEVSFIGYLPKEIPFSVTTRSLVIRLEEDFGTLDEAIVIGYGETSKRFNTGSVATITSKDIEKQPVTNVLSALSGRMPGVFVQTTNGLPGGNIDIQIRGKGSIAAGTAPLYIIDGVPFASTSLVHNTALADGINGSISPLNSMNPYDIESITVLKDADATAIYGSRGGNGVIIITTKKSKAERTKIEVNVNQGFSQVANKPNLLGLSEYLEIRREAYKNDGLEPSSDPISKSYAPDLTLWDNSSTDWFDYMIGKTAHSSDVQASISGGSTNTQFWISSNLRNESSVLLGENSYKRGGTHLNIVHHSSDNKFNSTISMVYNNDNNKLVDPFLSKLILLPPNFPIYDINGEMNWDLNENPFASIRRTTKSKTENVVLGGLFSYSIFPRLNIKTNIALNSLRMDQVIVNPKSSSNPNNNSTSRTYFGDNSVKSFIIEPQINYKIEKEKSSFNFLLGSSIQRNIREGEIIDASGFSSELLLENMAAASTVISRNSFLEYRYISFFTRATFNILEKYLINATLRRDGSSRFGPNNQFGNFGAIGAAWIFSNEKLLKDNLSFLSFAKLRTSYGLTGNDQIADYQYLSSYRSSGYNYLGYAGLTPSRIANDDFRWEENKKFEAGLEVGILRDRFFLNLNYFDNRSGNQLINYTLPSITGFASYQANLPATIKNTGIEFELLSRNIKKENFNWSTSFNFTRNRNRLKSFPGIESSSYSIAFRVGESILRAYGYRSLEVDPETGKQLYELNNGETSSTPLFENIYLSMGDRNPSYYGGLNNTVVFKRIQLDLFAQFSKQYLTGGLIYPGGITNNFGLVANRWQKIGDKTDVPKASTKSDSYLKSSSTNFFDASYIRLKNVSVSYTIPSAGTKKNKIEQIRIYAQGQNLLTLWNRNAALSDPESGTIANIPPYKTWVLGLQMSL